MEYHKDEDQKQHENHSHVRYEKCGRSQTYTKQDHSKQTEDNRHTRYQTGRRCASGSETGHRSSRSDAESTSAKSRSTKSAAGRGSVKSAAGRGPAKSEGCPSKSAGSGKRSSEHSLAQRLSRCYEIKRAGRRNECNRKTVWQHGRYVRDECGSGIVAKRFDFRPSRKVWCKTPLTMYQATIGDLARKLLCREVRVPRDVLGEPPSNIAEYIMPPCRGYYRKYDCLRPCEEEYAVTRAGRKEYRDRVQRYWEPCYSKDQKHQLDVNDYAPHNVFLGLKLRRQNVTDDVPCW